jgi:glutamate/aspartate transport system permease protein
MVWRLWAAVPQLAEGMSTTLTLFSGALGLGLLIGTLLAALRDFAPAVWSAAAGHYVNGLRAIPTILLIFWMFTLIPYGLKIISGDPYASLDAMTSALIALSLTQSAYFCEIIRAGFRSVPEGQRKAAKALGLSNDQYFRFIALPQALRNMSPVLVNQSIGLFKDTTLVYVVSLQDFLGMATMIGQRDNYLIEFYVLAALVYLGICSAGVGLVKILQKKRFNG